MYKTVHTLHKNASHSKRGARFFEEIHKKARENTRFLQGVGEKFPRVNKYSKQGLLFPAAGV